MTPLAYVLAASLAANAALGWAWLDVRDDLAVAKLERDGARSSASACSDATDDLRDLADQRAAVAKAAQAKARAAGVAAQRFSQQILATPASVPGNDCASARDRIDIWLRERATQ